MVSSLFAEMVADLSDHFAGDGLGELIEFAFGALGRFSYRRAPQTRETAFSMPRFNGHWIGASGNGLLRLRGKLPGRERWRWWFRRRRHQKSWLATSRTIWAPMFSRPSLSSISLATGDGPSLVMRRRTANFFSMTTLRPLGPRVTFTAVGQKVDAAQDCLAGTLLRVRSWFCHDAFFSY